MGTAERGHAPALEFEMGQGFPGHWERPRDALQAAAPAWKPMHKTPSLLQRWFSHSSSNWVNHSWTVVNAPGTI